MAALLLTWWLHLLQIGKSHDGATIPAAVRQGIALEAVRVLGLNTESVIVIYVSGNEHNFGSFPNAGCVRLAKAFHWNADSVVASARRHISSVAAKGAPSGLNGSVIGDPFSAQMIAYLNLWRRYLTAVLQRDAYLGTINIWQIGPQRSTLSNYQRLLHRAPLQISSNNESARKYRQQYIEKYLKFIHKRFTAPVRMPMVVILLSVGLLVGIKGNMELISGRIFRGTALVILTFVLGAFAMLLFASGSFVFPA